MCQQFRPPSLLSNPALAKRPLNDVTKSCRRLQEEFKVQAGLVDFNITEYEMFTDIVSDFFLFFFCFLGPHPWHMEVPRLGVESELSCQPLPQPQRIRAAAHSNARSLTHWARPGNEPASSWMLVSFVNRWSTWELLLFQLIKKKKPCHLCSRDIHNNVRGH